MKQVCKHLGSMAQQCSEQGRGREGCAGCSGGVGQSHQLKLLSPQLKGRSSCALRSWPYPVHVVGPLPRQPDGDGGEEDALGRINISEHEGLARWTVLELAHREAAPGGSCWPGMRGEGGAKGVGWEVALSIVALDMARAVVSDVAEEGTLQGWQAIQPQHELCVATSRPVLPLPSK